MGFSFAAPDYALRAQAGMPIDPAAGDQVMATPAPTPVAAPAPQQDPYKPGLMDILQGYLFHGQSPAEAAMAARQRQYQVATMARMGQMLQSASPAELKAILTNPGKFGEEIAKNFAPISTAEGASQTMFGGPGSGGSRFTAPKMVFDEKSGIYGTQTPSGYQPTAQNGGDFSLSPTGAEISGRTGLTGRTVNLPQIVPAGSGPGSFTPTITGPGGNATAPLPALPGAKPTPGAARVSQGALLGSDGSLDPTAFFKAFVLPHEGGMNPRDLNGSPTKYGINAKSNPDIDLEKLSPEGAATVFATKYFANSGAAHLPPALAAVHADTAFINPKKAGELLTQSGGDPSKYMDMREAWLNGLVDKYPAAAKYADAWASRNADLRSLAGKLSGGPSASGAPLTAAGWQGGQPRTPRLLQEGDPRLSRFPAGTVVQEAPNGDLSVVQRPEYDPAAKSSMREKVLTSPEYTQAKGAISAYRAMVANANTMTGPSAYSMLDTFARAINPGAVARPTVIETIEKNLGLPAQFVGSLESKFGKGNLPPQVRQQILNAVIPFAQAHWDQANMLNAANSALAQKHGFDPADVTAPLEFRPLAVTLGAQGPIYNVTSPADVRGLPSGSTFKTPDGRLKRVP